MLIRYLKPVILKKLTKTKQSNGTYIDTYETIKEYNVIKQNLTDEVDAEVYGADINKIIRIKSPLVAVTPYKIDISRLSGLSNDVSLWKI